MPEETLRTVRQVFRFPVLTRLWKYIVAAAVYSMLVVMFGRGLQSSGPGDSLHDRGSEALIAGILFGWLMSFRTQTSYARWWDGRSLWGQLVNDSRNLALKAAVYIKDETELKQLGAALVQFAEVLRDHLRLPPGTSGPHRPMAVAAEVLGLIQRWRAEGRIDGFAFLALDEHARQLMNVCGACEKIRATPLASSYRGLLRKGIAAYLLLLPWILCDEDGWSTVPIMVLVTYAVVGLELIASGIEDPFGFDGDDLRLDDIVETIRRGVGEAVG